MSKNNEPENELRICQKQIRQLKLENEYSEPKAS